MRNTLIVGILSIGVLALASVNAYAWPGDYAVHSDEKVLDLSKPENIARLSGTWEGTYRNFPSNQTGQLLREFSFDPKDEENPVLMKTKRRPAGLLGGPDKWSNSRARIVGGKLEQPELRYDTTTVLYERADGTLVVRGHSEGVLQSQGSQIMFELYQLREGEVSKFFPPDKKSLGAQGAQR